MNIPSTYSPRVLPKKRDEASRSLDRAKAEIEGQRRALKNMR